ncbi:MAG: hypothetical protein KatS3mg105_2470 [Gemmatales bacterium]|nr:MAG: hypothetical protein KatS3mg105_2470 [Gemmatales bacterium]
MRFALLGDHPDGISAALALARTGRHQLACFGGASKPHAARAVLENHSLRCPFVPDVEEILADPLIEWVIVAGSLDARAQQLRRALRSERPVLCVFPPDLSPDIAYEASLIQQDTRQPLFPILLESLHPACQRLSDLLGSTGERFELIEIERQENDDALAIFRDWQLLRHLGGEIVEVSAFAAADEVRADQPLLLAGQFENGGIFHSTHLPSRTTQAPGPRLWPDRLRVWHGKQCYELVFASADGQAMLTATDENGHRSAVPFEQGDPWARLVAIIESSWEQRQSKNKLPLCWQDAVRSLELADAAKRSVKRRRTSLLDYQEANEEVGFKGTMTLVGCGMLWLILLLLIGAAWFPWLLYLIAPVLVLFLLLQTFRWIIPPKTDSDSTKNKQ